ncbi:MAG: phenylalanine 4-monooxygenase [Planctomycetota bacterium]
MTPLSPTGSDSASFQVSLSRDHPGLHDLEYRRRRDEIAALALAYEPGNTPPRVAYTAAEQATWRTIWEHLRPAHERFASVEVNAALDRWAPWEREIPQLDELADESGPLDGTGFRFEPVPGLVPSSEFFSSLRRGVFQSTQYMRHPSRPLYTPEPDLVHELVGHAGTFAIPGVAALSRAFGEAAEGAGGSDLQRLERLYWFTVEFGLVAEGGSPKAFGAGLLSSAGELAGIQKADVRPFDVGVIEATAYGTSDLQTTLFVAGSLDELVEETLAAVRR